MNIKRYDIFPVNHQAGNEIENTDGRYVRLEDVSDLQQRLADAERRNAELVELLRNPTDEMIEAGNNTAVVEMEHDSDLGSCGWIDNADEVLKAMLDAALNKPEEVKP